MKVNDQFDDKCIVVSHRHSERGEFHCKHHTRNSKDENVQIIIEMCMQCTLKYTNNIIKVRGGGGIRLSSNSLYKHNRWLLWVGNRKISSPFNLHICHQILKIIFHFTQNIFVFSITFRHLILFQRLNIVCNQNLNYDL